MKGGSSLDPDAFALYLMQPMPADELPCETTFYKGVQRVRPGTLVEFGPKSEVVRHTYWDWPSRVGQTAPPPFWKLATGSRRAVAPLGPRAAYRPARRSPRSLSGGIGQFQRRLPGPR